MRSGARESTQPCAQSSVSAFWLGFMIEGLGFRLYGSGLRVKRLEFGDVSHFLFSDQKPNPKL